MKYLNLVILHLMSLASDLKAGFVALFAALIVLWLYLADRRDAKRLKGNPPTWLELARGKLRRKVRR